jgi:precorrin-8X/cobalt-precorrin-8 methylmutase
MSDPLDYVRDGAEIYRRSFSIIRSEARLDRFDAEEERVAVRIIHACGMIEIADEIVFSPSAVKTGIGALDRGAPILCDSQMVADGITRTRLARGNEVICTLRDGRVTGLAEALGTTRTAAAMELWRDRLDGAVVAIGNAPTALFRLFEMIDAGAPRPALVVGIPVGFVGAAESKAALEARIDLASIVVRGRRGGSAMTAAAVNALASAQE